MLWACIDRKTIDYYVVNKRMSVTFPYEIPGNPLQDTCNFISGVVYLSVHPPTLNIFSGRWGRDIHLEGQISSPGTFGERSEKNRMRLARRSQSVLVQVYIVYLHWNLYVMSEFVRCAYLQDQSTTRGLQDDAGMSFTPRSHSLSSDMTCLTPCFIRLVLAIQQCP
jgi:hypothetical protein